MSELPMPYDPALDEPLQSVTNVSDDRVQMLAAAGAGFQQLIRDTLSASPYVEQAVRYVDLAVQAAYTAAQESPPAGSGESQEQPTGS